MICPHCSFGISGVADRCPQCHLPIRAEGSDDPALAVVAKRTVTSNVKEHSHNWVLIGGIGGLVIGFAMMGSSPIGGLLVVVAAVATLAVTGMGKHWDNLEPSKKAVAVPGLAFGLIVIVMAVVVFAAVGAAASDS